MTTVKCPSCGRGGLKKEVIETVYNYRGVQTKIPKLQVYVCDKCDEEIVTDEEARRMGTRAKRSYERAFPGRVTLRVEPQLHQLLAQVQGHVNVTVSRHQTRS